MIAASSAGMIGFGRGASTDMLVSAPFALAMMCWWTWHQTPKKLWLLLFYGLLGIGALAKGGGSGARGVGGRRVRRARRDGKIFLRTLSVTGFLLFAAIVLPWYLAVQHKVPQFFRCSLLSIIWNALAPISISIHNHSGITFQFFCWPHCPGRSCAASPYRGRTAGI